MNNSRTVKIFYSWQSDSPTKTNRSEIWNALRKAVARVMGALPEVALHLDEATRDAPGSPNIVDTVLEKIERADVMVADTTVVTPHNVPRPCPNPNVTFELGYAAAVLGWHRIVMLFNEEFGDFPKDVPFDFSQNRTLKYKKAESGDQGDAASLVKILVRAIIRIIESNPQRPRELRGLSREMMVYERDVQNIRWFLSNIDLTTVDEHIAEVPYKIKERTFWFWEGCRDLVSNSLFHLYDAELREAVEDFVGSWATTMSHDEQYTETHGGRIYVFASPGDSPLPKDRQEAWDRILRARTAMRQALDQLLAIVRQNYIEVDISATTKAARKQYADFHKAMEDVAGGVVDGG